VILKLIFHLYSQSEQFISTPKHFYYEVDFKTVRQLIKLNATVTSRLPAGTATIQVVHFIIIMERNLTRIGETVLGGESCSYSWEQGSVSCV
jgi:hypothetical protein